MRVERLSAALKANLRRRKTQAKERARSGESGFASGPPSGLGIDDEAARHQETSHDSAGITGDKSG